MPVRLASLGSRSFGVLRRTKANLGERTVFDSFLDPAEYNTYLGERQMPEQHLNYSSLDWTTQPGIFIAERGTRYWVFDSFRGKFAVRLDGSQRFPQFKAHLLKDTPIAGGACLGPVTVWPEEESNKSFRGRVGVLVTCGLRWFLKAIDEDDVPMRLAILPSDLGTPHRHASFYPQWKLRLAVGGSSISVFESSPDPPRVPQHLPTRTPPRPPKLVWSSGQPS